MQQIEYAFRSAQIQRTTTTRGTNSTYTHSSPPLDINTSSYEKRKRGRGRVVELTPRILIRVSSPRYRFNTPRSDCTLRLHEQACTQRQQIKIKTVKKRERRVVTRGEEPVIPSKSTVERRRSRIITNRSLRGRRRQSRRRASKCCNFLRNRCTDLPFRKYTLEGGRFCRGSSEKERHLNSYVLMIDEPRLGMENTKFFSPRLFTTREIPEGCLSFRVRRNV